MPASASAEERTCRGSLGAVTVDKLRVPQGASCTLTGTRVKGTIKVERAATLSARGVRVVGNVQGENARRVDVIRDSGIGGSVQVKQGAAARVLDSRVNADIQYDANRAALEASRNVVGGSIQVFQNTGGVHIARNRVNGNLQCKENRPAPTGGGNDDLSTTAGEGAPVASSTRSAGAGAPHFPLGAVGRASRRPR